MRTRRARACHYIVRESKSLYVRLVLEAAVAHHLSCVSQHDTSTDPASLCEPLFKGCAVSLHGVSILCLSTPPPYWRCSHRRGTKKRVSIAAGLTQAQFWQLMSRTHSRFVSARRMTSNEYIVAPKSVVHVVDVDTSRAVSTSRRCAHSREKHCAASFDKDEMARQCGEIRGRCSDGVQPARAHASFQLRH